MPAFTKECIQTLNAVPLHRLISAEGSGMTKHCRCPKCGADGKKKGKRIGMNVVDDDIKNKHLIKCNSCGFGAGGGAINVIMTLLDLNFVDACNKIADETGIQLKYEEKKIKDLESLKKVKRSLF